MPALIQLVQNYQNSHDIEERVRLADEICCEIGPELHRYMRSRVHRESVSDALQETLIAIVDALPQLKGRQDAEVWSWCYGVARRKCANQFRGRKVTLATIVDTDLLRESMAGAEAETAMSAADRADLEYAVRLLKSVEPPCLNHLWDRYVVGLSYAEMGIELGVTTDAARMRVQRCLRLAQELLEK